MELIGIIVAIVICYFMDRPVSKLLDKTSEKIELVNPEGIGKDEWESFINPKGKKEGGEWLGKLERILAFFSFYSRVEILIGGWLIFKVGSKWQVWSNLIQIPDKLENVNDFSYLRARQRWGSWLLMRFLTGTLANILIGFVLSLILKKLMS